MDYNKCSASTPRISPAAFRARLVGEGQGGLLIWFLKTSKTRCKKCSLSQSR
jgi:hypothetical protein